MFRSRQLRFLISVGLAIVLVVVLLIIAFSRSPSVPHGKPMASYANNPTAQVAMLIDGPVDAVSLHNQVQIVITNSSTTINIFQGYDNQVMKSRNFPMTEASFHVFLRSLEYANYNSGSNNPKLSQASGYCPTGDRYIFTFDVNNAQVQRYWASTCGGAHTYNGNLSLTITLFQAQIPQYNNLVTGLNL